MPHRTFNDSLGRKWDVWTVVPSTAERRRRTGPSVPPNPPGIERRTHDEVRMPLSEEWVHGWLAFETKGERRRLAPYPTDWLDREPSDLERLCREAMLVPVRRLVE